MEAPSGAGVVMMKHYVDAEGRLLGTFTDPIDSPEGATAVDTPPSKGTDIWNGSAWVPDLTAAKAAARAKVSADAEAARLQFITPGSGKAMSYQEKKDQALKFLADPLRGEEGHAEDMYPLIYAEVGITADDEVDGEGNVTKPAADGVAEIIAERFEQFKQIEAFIGRKEAWAQKVIKDAVSVAEIDALMTSLNWTIPQEE